MEVFKVNNLRSLRIKNHFTQKELAEKMGCTPQYISDVEVGKYQMSVKFLIRAADVFGVKVADVIGETEV